MSSASPSSSASTPANNEKPVTLGEILRDLKQAIEDELEEIDKRKETDALKLLAELPGFDVSSLYLCKRITEEEYNEEFKCIETYITNGQCHGFQIEILDILRIIRDGDFEFKHNPQKARKLRLMLWHGTKKEAIANILKNGFQKPTAKGQMFGSGIYFADRVSKSTRYCFGSPPPADPPKSSEAYLLLCDVLVGIAYNAKNPKHGIEVSPATKNTKFDSVKCTGEFIPDIEEQVEHGGAKWPIGKTVKNTKFPSYSVRYNEFIVYEPENIKIKYVVKVKLS